MTSLMKRAWAPASVAVNALRSGGAVANDVGVHVQASGLVLLVERVVRANVASSTLPRRMTNRPRRGRQQRGRGRTGMSVPSRVQQLFQALRGAAPSRASASMQRSSSSGDRALVARGEPVEPVEQRRQVAEGRARSGSAEIHHLVGEEDAAASARGAAPSGTRHRPAACSANITPQARRAQVVAQHQVHRRQGPRPATTAPGRHGIDEERRTRRAGARRRVARSRRAARASSRAETPRQRRGRIEPADACAAGLQRLARRQQGASLPLPAAPQR